MEIAAGVLGLMIIVIIGAALLTVGIMAIVMVIEKVTQWSDPPRHDFYCICRECREKEIRTEVQRREWHQQRDEIEAAASELFKDLGKRRPTARPGRSEER